MKKPAVALILLNGELHGGAEAKRLAKNTAAVICADGGTKHAVKLGLVPKLVIGDMDSLPARLPKWKGTVYLADFDADSSDFEKALRFVVEHGFAEAWVAGAIGGRLDHTLVNLALLERYSSKLSLKLADEPKAAIMHQGEHAVPTRKGAAVTLLSVGEGCHLSGTGLQYPVDGLMLERGSRGLSNRATGSEVRITIHSGAAWVLY